MARRYAEAEEYAAGVTREQEDIALDAWETAWDAALKDASKKRLAAQGITCY